MFKRVSIITLSVLLQACGGGGGGGGGATSDTSAYQASSPGQGDSAVTAVQELATGLVAPQFMALSDGFLYVADRTTTAEVLDGTVRKVDTRNGNRTAIGSVRGPVGVAFSNTGALFVTGTNPISQPGLMAMVLPSGTLVDKVQGRSPAGVAFEPGGYAYFVDGSGNVVVLDSGLSYVRNIGIAGDPVGVAYANNYVYVTLYNGGANALYRFLRSGTMAAPFASSTFFNRPTAIAARSSVGELYVVNSGGTYEQRSILKVTADGTVTPFLSAQNTTHQLCAPSGVAVDDANAVLYIANGSCPGSANAVHAGKLLKVALRP